jgi:hypothetical protein
VVRFVEAVEALLEAGRIATTPPEPVEPGSGA